MCTHHIFGIHLVFSIFLRFLLSMILALLQCQTLRSKLPFIALTFCIVLYPWRLWHFWHFFQIAASCTFNFTSPDVFHNYHKIYILVHIYNFLQSIHRLHVSALLDHHQALYMNRFLILVHFGTPNCYKDVIKILCATLYIKFNMKARNIC